MVFSWLDSQTHYSDTLCTQTAGNLGESIFDSRSVLRLREGPSPRPHLQRHWSSPCGPTTTCSWRRSASAPKPSCTVPSSSRPTGPSPSSASILIDSTVTSWSRRMSSRNK